MSIRHLDLFAGVGGFSLAVEWLGGETVAFVEWDAWNRRVLAKHWPGAHFHGDIKTLTADVIRGWGVRATSAGIANAKRNGRDLWGGDERKHEVHPQPVGEYQEVIERGRGLWSDVAQSGGDGSGIDLITGGYPCQPFSLAGQRLGAKDDRHLWPEMRRVVNLIRPTWVLAENVAGHVTMGLDTVLSDLEADGYTCGAVVVPACAVNALHRRDRVWIVAHAAIDRSQAKRFPRSVEQEHSAIGDSGSPILADAEARGIRCGWAPGHDGQPALSGEGVSDSGGRRQQPSECNREGSSRSRSTGNASTHERTGSEIARPLDIETYGLPAGLVRRPATRSPGPDLIRAAWADGSWEWDLPRVVEEEPERRQKLQAAGNAIVPIVAYEILRVMLADAA